jgi:cupin superfamily acireductone dioxygenase involved in methionine salvage
MLDTFGKTDSNGISLYQKLLDSISNDEKLQKGDFLNLEEKNQYIKELLENFFQENLDTIKELSGASDKTKAAF